ncbi:MAG: glutamate-5-semialdehyde dehydrogenase, partial [Pseudomonadota bacterium]
MSETAHTQQDIGALMADMGVRAKGAVRALGKASPEQKNKALHGAAAALRAQTAEILAANAKDMAAGEAKGLTAAMMDRLKLDEGRIEGVAKSLEDIAALPDPVGAVVDAWDRPNGLQISRVRVPLGVIGIIYESRPNVTADAGALCLKSGNAVILRGGSESHHSSRAIHAAMLDGLRAAGLPEDGVQLVPTTDRAAVGEMLRGLDGAVDVIVPRGGKSLVARVQEEARIPVLGHLEGLCHVYVDGAADIDMAKEIAVNAKMRRTGICGAAETLLIDRKALTSHLPVLADALIDAGCALRGDAEARGADDRITPAAEEDWTT